MAKKLRRLQAIVAERANWAMQLTPVKRMRQWVLDVEHILDGSWAQADEVVNTTTVGSRLDSWRQQLARQVIDDNLGELEQECLTEFLRVLTNLRPYLVQCYDRKDFPRTNNEMERSIRGRKHAVSPHQRAQELEQLFVTLQELGRLCGLVGAGCGSSPTTGAPSCSPGSCALARTPAGHQSSSE